MESILSGLQTAISFILVFGAIVFFHELGHFTVAKLNGIYVREFALGMGPTLVKKQVGETVYAIRVFPLGGFIKMEGEDEVSDNPRSFSAKKPWQRFLTIFAGPFMNILLAIIVFTIVFMTFGTPSLVIEEMTPGMPAELAGLAVGDKIVAIDGDRVSTWEEVVTEIILASEEMEIMVLRDGQELSFTVTPYYNEEYDRNMLGFTRGVSHSPFMAIKYAFNKVGYLLQSILDFFRNLITGNQVQGEVVGPVGLVGIVGESARAGVWYLVDLMAYLSLNLAVVNLLPLPALDGGRIMFIFYEMITRKPVPAEKEGFVHFIGFVALMVLMVFIMYKDIVRLFS